MYLKIEQSNIRLGLISDTHGMFRPEINECFKNVDYILHAGDIGKPSILHELEQIAPTIAVLGNIDIPAWFPELQKTSTIETEKKRIYLLHNLDELDFDPVLAEFDAIICGHTHKYSTHRKRGVWYINPGSAGPPRFLLPVGVAVMEVGEEITVEHYLIKSHASKEMGIHK
jgi:uncharacterized protein